MTVCERSVIMQFYCVTSRLLVLSWVATVPHSDQVAFSLPAVGSSVVNCV